MSQQEAWQLYFASEARRLDERIDQRLEKAVFAMGQVTGKRERAMRDEIEGLRRELAELRGLLGAPAVRNIKELAA